MFETGQIVDEGVRVEVAEPGRRARRGWLWIKACEVVLLGGTSIRGRVVSEIVDESAPKS